MRRNGPTSYYSAGSCRGERLRLDPGTMARGGADESWLVTDRCPRAIQRSMAALMDLRPAIAKLRMTVAFRVTLPHLRADWENDTHHAYHHAGSGKRQVHAFTALHMGGVHGPLHEDHRRHTPSLREG